MKNIINILSELGSVEEINKFQKIVYILKRRGLDINEKFKFNYNGPYSANLQLKFEELIDRNIIKKDGGIYQLDDKIDDSENIKKYNKLIQFLNNQNIQILILVSSIFYLEEHLTKDENIIKSKIETLIPSLKHLIKKAFIIKEKIKKITSKECFQ